LALAVAWLTFRGRRHLSGLFGLANAVLVLVVCQVLLGCATWVVNYYWPGWVPDWSWTARYAVIEDKGSLQKLVVTGLRRLELFGRNCLALVVREFGGVGEGEEQRLAGKAEEKTGGRRVWAARR
jgi:hypothetical protein